MGWNESLRKSFIELLPLHCSLISQQILLNLECMNVGMDLKKDRMERYYGNHPQLNSIYTLKRHHYNRTY
jgi:hypothetical protein